jgi:hypothetical protein
MNADFVAKALLAAKLANEHQTPSKTKNVSISKDQEKSRKRKVISPIQASSLKLDVTEKKHPLRMKLRVEKDARPYQRRPSFHSRDKVFYIQNFIVFLLYIVSIYPSPH